MLSLERKGRITASSAGAILGLCPWRKPEDVLRDMVREYHNAPREFTGNPATQHGTLHEREALNAFQNEYLVLVEPAEFYKYEDWLGATPDGISSDGYNVECKCPFGLRAEVNPEFKPIPAHYYAQVQLQMFCANRQKTYFIQYATGAKRMDVQVIDLDEQWLADNLPRLRAFYDLYLSELDNPVHLEPLRVAINNERAAELLEQIDQYDSIIHNAETERKAAMAELVDMAADKDALVHGRKLTKVVRKGAIQYSKVPEIKAMDLEQYRGKESVSWRLS